jgi:hypothetical protein
MNIFCMELPLDFGEKQKNVWDDDDDERRSHARVTVEDSFVIL